MPGPLSLTVTWMLRTADTASTTRSPPAGERTTALSIRLANICVSSSRSELLWCNLLTSQALVFNLFGPFKQRPALATTVMRRLMPDLVADVAEVLFEHSPGRGHPRYTADHTAFDVLFRVPHRSPKHATLHATIMLICPARRAG
jgi:hypothetical protein